MENSLVTIAYMQNCFPEKFGIPRQSGLVDKLRGRIVFEPEFRSAHALRGLEEYSHIWLLWGFSKAQQCAWSPTVRPPRLGGNTRMGVFATRSPYRPNQIGLSSVEIERIEWDTPQGAVIHVLGADLLDGTPIFDIKPYLPFTDSHPNAVAGFAEDKLGVSLHVNIEDKWLEMLTSEDAQVLIALLAQDPRPSYQHDPTRIYGMAFGGHEVKFVVDGEMLTVKSIEKSH